MNRYVTYVNILVSEFVAFMIASNEYVYFRTSKYPFFIVYFRMINYAKFDMYKILSNFRYLYSMEAFQMKIR